MRRNINTTWHWLAAAVLIHLVVSFVHGAAHDGAHVPMTPAANLFVLVVILAGPVVGTLMTNFGLEQAFERAGIAFMRADVGDRHVHRTLVGNGGCLGGEASGHILCLDRASTGDGMVSALAVLETLADSGRALADLAGGWLRYPQTTVNVPVGGNARAVVDADDVRAARASVEQRLSGRGRVVLRPSGTEPVIRVTIEAQDAAEVRALVAELAAAVAGTATA